MSSARASAVVRQLINMNVNPIRLQAVGYAEYIPRDRPTDRVIDNELIAELNLNGELKSRNRRVEITFLASGVNNEIDDSSEESLNN